MVLELLTPTGCSAYTTDKSSCMAACSMGCYWLDDGADQRGCFFGKLNDAAAKAGTVSYSAAAKGGCKEEVYYRNHKEHHTIIHLNVSRVDVYEWDLIANLSSNLSLQTYVKREDEKDQLYNYMRSALLT